MPINFARLDNVRIAVALLAAVITGGAALYGVATNARDATTASYETLAPEINALKQEVSRLSAENEQLRQAIGARAEAPPVKVPPAAGRAPVRRPRAAGAPSSASRPSDPPSPSPPEAARPESTPSAPPPAGPPPGSPPAPEQGKPPGGDQGGVKDEIRKRVPIDFEKAVEIWKDVKNLPKKQ